MYSEADIAKFRAQTRGVNNVLHFNNAGSSLPPDIVHDTVVQHLEREREIGGYEAKAEAAPRFDQFYFEVAKLIGAKPAEIAFIENATRAWDMAFYSLPLNAGDEIITIEAEYASNYLAYLQAAKHKGVVIKVAPNDASGQVDVVALEKLISKRTKLISVTHVPSQGGLINPASQIGKVAKAHGILYLLDACQSVGQLEIDVNEIGCDMLSATGRKFLRGPRGTGFLYVKEELANTLEPVFIDLHAAEWLDGNKYELAKGAIRFENWECFFAGKLGLMQAAKYANDIGVASIASRNKHLSTLLRDSLAKIDGVHLTDLGVNKSAIVTFFKDGISPEECHAKLRAQNINVSVSPSSYARLDLGQRKLASLIRSSIHYYNTETEIEKFCSAVHAL
jgi:cysteine desulfurase / selenocysteine lyase